MKAVLASLCVGIAAGSLESAPLVRGASFLQGRKHTRRTDGDVAPKLYKLSVLNKFDHVDKPFTQGLEYDAKRNELVETSGSFPPPQKSYVRGIDPATGKTTWSSKDGLSDDAFIEGIAQDRKGSHWYASVYQEPRYILEFDENLTFLQHHPYTSNFDGWGLSRNLDGTGFFATNGSSTVMTLKPGTFELIDSKPAMCMGQRIPALNELELVDNFLASGSPALLGNVYTSRIVLVLDPKTMNCMGAFDLDDLDEAFESDEGVGYHVANGIAYNSATDTYFLTGKNWASMFEVKLEEPTTALIAEAKADDTFDKLEAWLKTKHTAPGILALIQGSRNQPFSQLPGPLTSTIFRD